MKYNILPKAVLAQMWQDTAREATRIAAADAAGRLDAVPDKTLVARIHADNAKAARDAVEYAAKRAVHLM